MRRKLFLFLLLWVALLSGWGPVKAQAVHTVTGTVKDESGKPLGAVSVIV